MKDVRVPASALLRAKDAVRDRAGAPRAGRIDHCMRTIGVAEEAWRKCEAPAIARGVGKRSKSIRLGERVARARIDIDMTCLLCLKAADMMDKVGNKSAKQEIVMIKVQAPNMALKIMTTRSRRMAAAACPTITGWTCMRPSTHAAAARTGRMKCTLARLPH